MVLRLAGALRIPLRERNVLLASAGLPPAYPESELSEETMRPVRRVLERVLAVHEPYPAWVVRPGLRFVASNRAAETLFPGLCALAPEAIADLWFSPGPFLERVENWQDVAWAGLSALRRDASTSVEPGLQALVARVEASLRGVPRPPPGSMHDLPVVCPRLRIGERIIRTISTILRFDTAVEVTASELRIELMFPADDDSDAVLRTLLERSGPVGGDDRQTGV
jgi:hypothetical protein